MPGTAGRLDIYIPDQRIASSVPLAIEWAFSHLSKFSPFDENDTYSPSRAKPFFELAIMLGVYAAVTGDRESPAIRKATQFLHTASERADFTDWALRFPADIVNYAELCAALDELGGDAGELRGRLQAAVDGGALSPIERLPHRLLELRAALDWAGIGHSLPSAADICAQTIVGEVPPTPLIPDSAIYAVTHVMLFGSRFGRAREALPEWFRSDKIRSFLSDLLVVAGQARNWDLLGELLLSWDCIGLEHGLITTAGWASFLDAFRADGAVPPRPASDVSEKAGPAGVQIKPDGEESDFGAVYHTTLVAALAGTVALERSGLLVPRPLRTGASP